MNDSEKKVASYQNSFLRPHKANHLLWVIENAPMAYLAAITQMEEWVKAIQQQQHPETIWLLEHPSLYTAGTSARMEDVVNLQGLPLYQTGRGGQLTYHGPGQRVIYVMVDLAKHLLDIRQYINRLEEWGILTLQHFGIQAERRSGRIGLWVNHKDHTEAKIAALGVRVKKNITFHGMAINISPDLAYFKGIIPCGLREYGVTSLQELGVTISLKDFDAALIETFSKAFY